MSATSVVSRSRGGARRGRRRPSAGRSPARDDARPQGVLDVVVDVGDAVQQAHDLALEGGRPAARRCGCRMPSRTSRVRLRPAPSRSSTSTTRRLWTLCSKRRPWRSRSSASRAASPAWPKGAWPRSWPMAMASTRSSLSARARATVRDDGRHLERVGQAGAVVVAGRGDEDLGLVLQPPERGGVEDPVAVALEGGAEGVGLLGPVAHRAGRAGRARARAAAPRLGAGSLRARAGSGRPTGRTVAPAARPRPDGADGDA